MEGFRVSYTKQFFALFGPISLWTFWPNHNMSASQLPSVWCDDPTARAKMQHLRAMICKANSTTLTFLLLFQLLVQVWDSYLRGPLKQKITYADMLHRSVNGYVEKWHANTTAEHKKNKQKKNKTKNGCSKDPPASDVVDKRVKGQMLMEYSHHKFPFIQTTQTRKIHSTTEERK